MTQNVSVFFHWNIIYYTEGHFCMRVSVTTFYIMRISVQPHRGFFSVKEFILFLYCSTVLLFFYLQYYTHVLQMWLTQHIHYTCDSKKTSVHAYQKRKLLDCWDICWYSFLLNLQWHRVSYFSNEMCFNFYYSAFVCYNETQCLHTVFSLRIKEFISFLIVICDILYIYDYHALCNRLFLCCRGLYTCNYCISEMMCVHLRRT